MAWDSGCNRTVPSRGLLRAAQSVLPHWTSPFAASCNIVSLSMPERDSSWAHSTLPVESVVFDSRRQYATQLVTCSRFNRLHTALRMKSGPGTFTLAPEEWYSWFKWINRDRAVPLHCWLVAGDWTDLPRAAPHMYCWGFNISVNQTI